MYPLNSRILAILFALIFVLSCSSGRVREGAGDRETYDTASGLIEEENYRVAIKVLRNMINDHPTSDLLEAAYFDIARAFYLDEENVDAEVAADDFIRLYPDSPLIPGALLLKGMTLERNVEKPGLDQTSTHEALAVYADLVSRYPDSEEAGKGKERMKRLREHLANHEISISKFYIRTDKYESAEKRLKRAFDNYSDTGASPLIVQLLSESYLMSGKMEEAVKLLDFMKKNYPDRKETREMERKISGDRK